MKKKDARDVAVSAITAFRKRSAWSDGFLRNEIRANSLEPRDAALATEITNGVLQNMLLLNYYISQFSSIKLNKISPGILDILQAAVYQILFLDRIPDSAAVNDAVNRAKRNNPRAAGFVNALTRRIVASKQSLPEIKGSRRESLSIKYSHPLSLVDELISAYGETDAEEILNFNNKRPKISIRINTLKTTYKDLLDSRNDDVLTFEDGIIPDSAYISFSGNVETQRAFSDGMFYIQDTASQVAALTLSPTEGAKVLDACAAPGGKSFLMAQLMNNSGEIISCDVYKHKLKLINDGAQKLGIDIIKTKLCDATEFLTEFEDVFDFVLADVPCSGIGIIRKKPDIRYKDNSELINLPKLQLKILNNVSKYVKVGGTLVYSTCTILPRENSDVVEAFLKDNCNFVEEREYFDIAHIDNKHGITLLPHISETDGFYMCKLRRKK